MVYFLSSVGRETSSVVTMFFPSGSIQPGFDKELYKTVKLHPVSLSISDSMGTMTYDYSVPLMRLRFVYVL